MELLSPISYPVIVTALTQVVKKLLVKFSWYPVEATPVIAIGIGLILGYVVKADIMMSLAVGLSAVGLYEISATTGGETIRLIKEVK